MDQIQVEILQVQIFQCYANVLLYLGRTMESIPHLKQRKQICFVGNFILKINSHSLILCL